MNPDELKLSVSAPPRRTVTLDGLSSRADLNGQPATVISYRAHERKFVVHCAAAGGNGKLVVQPSNLRDAVAGGAAAGAELTLPVCVRDLHDEKSLVANWGFEAGQVILDERPAIKNKLVDGDYDLADALQSFVSLGEPSRTSLLDLQANPGVHLTTGGGSSAEVVVSSLLKEDDGKEDAASFLRILDANAFAISPTHAGLFVTLSRVNHSCNPNAMRISHGNALRLIALRPIKAGDEITISYLKSDYLYEPREGRRERLSAWFACCWCERCGRQEEGLDDVRCFTCPVDAGLLKREASLVGKLMQIRDGDGEPLSSTQLKSLVQLADTTLSTQHWVTAGLRDAFAQTILASGGGSGGGLVEAATALEEYVKAWRSHKTSFGCGAYLTIAWRLERAGDCYAACGMVVEACRCYLEARAEVARLGLEPEEEEEGKKKKKAGGGGAVSEDGRAGAIEAKLRAMLCGGRVEVT